MDDEIERDPVTLEPLPVQAAEHEQDFVLGEMGLSASLALSHRWALELRQPVRYVDVDVAYRDDQGRPMPDFQSIHHRDETLVGLGDTELGARFRILRPTLGSPLTFDIRFGFTLPVGRTEEDPYELGRLARPHQHIQFGTGTVDPLVGFNAIRTLGSLGGLYGWGAARLPFYENTQGFRAGLRASGGVGFSTSLGLSEWSFGLGPEIYHEQPSRWHGSQDSENSGRTDLIVAANAIWLPSEKFAVEAGVKKPFTVHVVGGQLEIPLLVYASVSYFFGVFGSAAEEHDHEHGDEHDHGHGDEHGTHVDEHDEHGREHGDVAGAERGDVIDVSRHGRSFELTAALVPGKVTIIDFWAEWCEPCKHVDAVLRQLAARNSNLAVRRAEVTDLDSPVARQHLDGVEALPVVWIFDAQGRRLANLEATSAEDVERRIESIVGSKR